MKTIGFTGQLKQITGSGWKAVYIALFLLSASSLMQAEQPALRTSWNENLGIFWVQASEVLAHDLAISEKSTLVTGVSAGSAADKAGLKRGDIILRSDVWKTPGESGRMEISRGGEKLNLSITSEKHNLLSAKLVSDTTARAKPKTIVVDQSGKGDYRTITGAMTVVAFGDALLIRDGVYREEICLISGVTVQGTETRGARVESKFPFRIIGPQGATIRGLTVQGTVGFIIWNAEKIAVHDCTILTEKDADAGIGILGSSEVLVQGCSLSGSDKTPGVTVEDSQVRLTDNMISQYGLGIVLGKSSRANISHNLLDANEDGLKALDSQITVKKNTITGKGKNAGILFANSQATIEGNHIRRYSTGIYASQAQGEALNNTVSQNDIGIILRSGAFKISKNIIMGNKFYGIWLYSEEAASDASCQATIAWNTITGNSAYGISISKFKADIHHNLIEANGAGIAVKQSNTNIRNNTIVLQKVYGIEIGLNSEATIYNNIAAFNTFGIYSDVSSVLKMGFNNVYGNFATKEFPLVDGSYIRRDRLITRNEEKIHITIYPAYNLKADTDLTKDPKFVKLGSDYRPAADSPLAKKKGKDGTFIGAFPPATSTP